MKTAPPQKIFWCSLLGKHVYEEADTQQRDVTRLHVSYQHLP